jgi:microcystin-dependent protein
MPRVEVPITVINGTTGLPVSGAAVAIAYRSSGTAAPWWTSESGGTSSTSAVITDAQGRVNAWVDRGAYNLTVTGTGITTYTEPFDAAPAVDGSVDAKWASSTLVPIGIVLPYGGGAAPTGWLLCDGSAQSRSAFAALWGVIGTTFGSGDGSTTFNVPNLTARVPIGPGGGRVAGQSGGVETVALTTAELPAHSHGVTDPGHGHDIYNWFAGAAVNGSPSDVQKANQWGINTGPNFVNPAHEYQVKTGQGNSIGTGISIQNTGSGTAHTNMQPYLVMNYIIKASTA